MIPNLPLRRFVSGNPFFSEVTTANLNQSVDALNELRQDMVLNRDQLLVGDGIINGVFLGVVTDTGPSGESDDASAPRYWVKIQRPDDTLSAGDVLELVDEEVPGVSGTVRATNLEEVSTGHAIPTDETVYVTVFQVVYDTYPVVVHYYFFKDAGVRCIPVSLTQTGGSLGNKTTSSSWTYTVKTIDGATTIITGASPSVSRPHGTLAAASYGIGYYPADGSNFVLLHAFEIFGTGGC